MTDWTDQPTSIRQGEELTTDLLLQYLQKQLPDSANGLSIKQFPSGFSNLTYALKYGNKQYVLRRPPFGANIKSAHDMSREYRILSHLIDVYPKVPRPVLYCDDEAVLGTPFYIMERVEGIILRTKMPAPMRPDAPTMAGIANSLVDTLVELHAVDYQAAGLGELGRPEGYVARQVSGWTKRYFNAKTDEVPEIEQAAAWLAEQLPTESDSTLIHNDFKYDNLVLDSDDWTKVKAVLDWEMATIGDPLMDLGTTIGYWLNPNDPAPLQELGLSPTTLPGNPTRGQIAELYAQKSGRNIDHIVFYYVFGLFKIAVIVQQIYARFKKGHTQDPRFAGLIHAVRGLGMLAQQAVRKKRVDDLF